MKELKRNISFFSVVQRDRLNVAKEDIYYNFIYQIGVMMNDDDEKPTRHVEITYVGHQIRNLDDKVEQMPMSLEGMKQMAKDPAEEGTICILNLKWPFI